jgi:anti-repressor protein
MDKQLIPFDYNGKEVRTVTVNDDPWFVAKDVCDILDLSDVSMSLNRLDDDEKDTSSICTPGGMQEMSIVSESGLYSLTLGSKKPESKPFKRWVTHEVIPQIRKTGTYSIKPTDSYIISDPIERAQAWIKEQEQRKLLADKIEQDKPKVLFADSVATSKSSILVGELAKLICQNGYKIGEKRLFEWLRSKEYLISRRGSDRNMPTQKSVEMGLFETKITSIDHASGYTSEAKTPKVTGKGQTYFINKFLGLEGIEN